MIGKRFDSIRILNEGEVKLFDRLVSVIIPVYNVELYVEEAIQSIQKQTYKNIEIIIVDDSSTDKTYSIVNHLKQHDPRIKLYKNKKNYQIATTLNRAFLNSTGEYIVRMDGDDISMPDRIEKMVSALEKNNEYDLLGTSMTTMDEKGKVIGFTAHYSSEILLKSILKYVIPMSHIWIAKRIVYDTLGGYREISGAEDDDFIFRATSYGFRYTNLENYYGYYVRLGREGNSNSLLGLKKLKMRDYTYTLFLEQIKSGGKDTFSKNNLEKYIESNVISTKIYGYSSYFLYKAIESKGKKKYFHFIIFSLLSCISPYQVKYLYGRYRYRLIVKKHRKDNDPI